MNEKLQYAEMLNIPVNTSTITYKPKKRGIFKRKKDVEKVKEELIEKVNKEEISLPEKSEEGAAILNDTAAEEVAATEQIIHPQTVSIVKGKIKKPRAKFKVSVVGVELVVIGLLIGVICLTSALVPESGINVFFKNVFNGSSEVKDTRVYGDYSATLPVEDSSLLTVDGGVMTINAKSSVYPPCDGTVSALSYDEETKKYTMEITHGSDFKSVYKGIDYAYTEVGGAVFSNIPVGYVSSGATLCFYSGDGAVITGYTIENNAVVWAV